MTILGVGTDVVDIPTFAEQLDLPGSKLRDVFTSKERRRAKQRAVDNGTEGTLGGESQHLAANWALKEAFIKAWSGALSGVAPPLTQDEVTWSEIEVRHDLWGRPRVVLSGAIREWVTRSLGAVGDHEIALHASASHDVHVACALVVLEKQSNQSYPTSQN